MRDKKYLLLFICTLTACLLCVNPATGRLSFHALSAPLLTTFLISWLTSLVTNKYVRQTVQIIIGECVIAVCLIDCYCQMIFDSPVNPQIISNIFLSDLREIKEFLSVYIGSNVLKQWRLIVLMVLFLSLPFVLTAKWKQRAEPTPKLKYVWISLLVVCAVVEIPATYRFSRLFFNKHRTDKIEGLIFRHYDEQVQTPLHRFLISCYTFRRSADELTGIKRSTLAAEIDSCSFKSPHIVLVIGESYNKHHSSVYGYRLPTAQLQQKRKDDGQLFLFTDAVTPWNITSNVFLNMFSLWECSSENPITDYPLFPYLFRKSGYDVTFFTNQYILKGLRRGSTSQTGHFFLSDRELSKSLFTYRNDKPANFDLELIDQVVSYKNKKSQDYSLDIIHLIGQHFDYSSRYPSSEAFFTVQDYSGMPISDDAKQIVMHYDNATRYNDIVMDRLLSLYENEDAVVIYLSDHGEEVYDDMDFHGRLFQDPTAVQAKNEFEVPMWIWCSDTYRANHPDVVDAICESTDKPFLTDGIPQMLIWLAGIDCRWTDDSKNILSPEYICRYRIINGDTNYVRP